MLRLATTKSSAAIASRVSLGDHLLLKLDFVLEILLGNIIVLFQRTSEEMAFPEVTLGNLDGFLVA